MKSFPTSNVLAATENIEPEAKKKHNTLGRKLGAFASKLKRNTSSRPLGEDGLTLLSNHRRKSFSSENLDENVLLASRPSAVPSERAKTLVPLKFSSCSADEQIHLQSSKQQQLLSDNNEPWKTVTQSSLDKIANDSRFFESKMIAPQNPPPAIPSLNGAVFPKRTQVGTAADFLPTNGFSKASLNGHVSSKQSGTSQSSIVSIPTPATKPLPIKNEKDKPTAKEGQMKELVELPKYPKVKLNGYVGFASLPYQVVRRSQQRGFQFNLLCVGETGTGKTTLIESLFGIKLNDFEPCSNELNNVELRSKQCEITDASVNVKLRIVETAGFGDQLDKDKSVKVIVDFINAQFEARLKEELMVKRCLSHIEDKRIHACLYFISPTGHGLKALDIVTMKELSKRVNVIPVIAKSDTTSKDELTRFKTKILSELRVHNIEIYQFPVDDEAVADQNRKMNAYVPFAVVGSVDFVTKEDGSMVRARRYPWGIVEVENKEHCDFIYLREAILRTNVDALRERTQNVLYESYRRDRLRELRMKDGDAGPNMERACELRQREFKEDLERRDKKFNENFVQRVDEKEMELKCREELLNIRRREIEENYQNELRTLEQKIIHISDEKTRLDRSLQKKNKK